MQENTPTKTCLCNFCVHTVTKFSLIANIVGSLILSHFVCRAVPYTIMQVVLCCAVYYGLDHKQTSYHKTYLYVSAAGCMFYVVKISITVTGNFPFEIDHGLLLLISLLIAIVFGAFLFYFLLVVPYLSWKLLEHEVKARNHEIAVIYQKDAKHFGTSDNKVDVLEAPPAYKEKI